MSLVITKKLTTRFLYILIFCCICITGSAQKNKKAKLQKRKAAIEKKLKQNNSLLSSIRKEKKHSINELHVLNNKISLRKKLIQNINQQIYTLDNQIEETQHSISKTETEITKLKQEYAKIIQAAYKNRSKYDKIMFILASEDLNQGYKRLRYLQQYSAFRIQQTEELNIANTLLTEKMQTLTLQKKEKVELLSNERSESNLLTIEKKAQQTTVENLKKKSSSLKKDIAKKKKELNNVTKAIAKAIAAEIKARKQAKLSSAEIQLMGAFEKNTGKLPWPIDNGFISGYFGKQRHAIEKNIEVDNPGLYFTCKKGTNAKAVFNGTVSSIIIIPGSGKTVMLRHGKYLSVYSNLTEVFVQKGQKLKTNEKIGSIANNADNTSKFLFSIWKGQQKLNPKPWLRKSL